MLTRVKVILHFDCDSKLGVLLPAFVIEFLSAFFFVMPEFVFLLLFFYCCYVSVSSVSQSVGE